MLKSKFKWFSDPSHAWLRVPLESVRNAESLGMDRISAYSYMDSKYAYLEEDMDATTFLNFIKWDRTDIILSRMPTQGPSSIRKKQPYQDIRVIKPAILECGHAYNDDCQCN